MGSLDSSGVGVLSSSVKLTCGAYVLRFLIMNQTSTVHARLDSETKLKSEAILKELGMTPTEAVRLLYRQIALRGEFPVELRVPNKLTAEVLDKSDRDEEVESFASIEALTGSWAEE